MSFKKSSEKEKNLGDIRIRADVVHAIILTTLKEIDGVVKMGSFTSLEKVSSFRTGLKEINKLFRGSLKSRNFLTKFTKDIKQILSKKTPYKGIKVDIIDNQKTDIKILIVVEYGRDILQLAHKIQEKAKKSIELMTGLSVRKINVEIQGLETVKK